MLRRHTQTGKQLCKVAGIKSGTATAQLVMLHLCIGYNGGRQLTTLGPLQLVLHTHTQNLNTLIT